MTTQNFSKEEILKLAAEGKVVYIENQQTAQDSINDTSKGSIDDYIGVLTLIRKPKRHLTSVPAFVPKSFIDQIQFYDDGVNRRLYVFVNNVWRFAALT